MRGGNQSSCALCSSRHKNDAREVPVLLLEAYTTSWPATVGACIYQPAVVVCVSSGQLRTKHKCYDVWNVGVTVEQALHDMQRVISRCRK